MRGDAREGIDWRRERIIIAEPMPADTFVDSDGVIPPLDKDSPLSVVEQINARPSIIHRASTHSFPGKIRNVAVLRPDQLGDMVVSVPALLRLRELLPDARTRRPAQSGQCAAGAAAWEFSTRSSCSTSPMTRISGSAIMDRKGQAELARQLAPYKFDVAICFPIVGDRTICCP